MKKLRRFNEMNEGITEGPEKGNQKFVTSPRPNVMPAPHVMPAPRPVERKYNESQVVMLVMDFAMDTLGDEWVAQEDDNFKEWLSSNGLLKAWEKLYNDNES